MTVATFRTYDFRRVDHCAMCATSISSSRILGLRLDRSVGLNPRNKSGMAITIHRCNVCDLIYSNPEPKPAALTDHYDIPVDSYWNEEQLSQSIEIHSRHLNKCKTLLGFYPGMKALDVGVGVGNGFAALKQAGFDTWAIEPSPSFRKKALELTQADEERIQLSSIEEADFPDEHFDFVSLSGVFEHLYDPAANLRRCMKFLKPGGIWYAEVPSSNWLIARLINRYYKLVGTSFTTNLSPMHIPFHIHEFTHRTFVKNSEIGRLYEVCSYEYEVCPVRHFPKVLHPAVNKLMEKTGTGLQLHIWLRKT